MTQPAPSLPATAFADSYRRALRRFLADGSEQAREQAYALGRQALGGRLSLLDVVALHQQTLVAALFERGRSPLNAPLLPRSEAFLAEVLAPFEMMHRGYLETIQQLRESNSTLERRVLERTAALRESERRISRLARLYAILSGINSAIVRLREREELFREACRVAVNHGGFSMAWIALFDAEGAPHPAAWCGQHEGREAEPADAAAAAAALADAIAAVRSGCTPLIRQSPPDPQADNAPGYQASALLPLIVSEKVIGLFVLHAEGEAGFDGEESRLLTELSGDISFALEHIEREEQLSFFAYYDALTGLPNFNLMFERMERSLQAARRSHGLVAILLVDLVRFSNVNDSFGRHVGDQVLRQAGSRLKEQTRQQDTVARMGADRFAVLLTNLTDPSQVAHKLEREVLACFNAPFVLGDLTVHLSAQVGISLYPVDAANVETLYKNAEIALKRAQRDGERYLVFDPTMNQRIVHAVTLEAKLRRALEKEELVVHYQPKVASDGGRIVGLEALVRYIDPELGMVMPSHFVPLLEETGMIGDVGHWVMQRAAADYLIWHGRGLAVPRIAVNVSPIQMRQRDFVLWLEGVSAAEGGTALDIEITESALMEDVNANIPKLAAARELGFQISIDDFGTGYSSLNYLSKLPVHALKIDRSFIIGMTESPNNLSLVTSIISLAHAIGLKVIAEGVELEEQAKLLRLLRCEQIQGNLYGRAMPAEQIGALLGRG